EGRYDGGYWLAFCILLAVLLSPLTVDTVPPLLDYPIHLARSEIATEYANDPVLREIYEISWRPIPNLSGDIVLLFLGQLFNIEPAGRILLACCLAATVASVFVLHRVIFGSWSYWIFLAFLPAVHGALTAGFINYSIGVALLLFALAVSIRLRNSGIAVVTFVDAFAAMVLLFCHVIVVGIFGIYLFAIEIFSLPYKESIKTLLTSIRNSAIRIILPFIFPSIIYFSYSFVEVVSRPKFLAFGEWKFSDKIRSLMMPFLSGDFSGRFFVFSSHSTITNVSTNKKILIIRYDILTGSILVMFVSLLLPGQMLDAAFISDRLPIAAVLVGLTCCRPANSERRFSAVLLCSVSFVVVLRASNLKVDWEESSQYYDRLAQAVESIERGSSVLIVSPLTNVGGQGLRYWWELRSYRPRWHFALFNIPTLHALSAVLLTHRSAFTQLHFVWSDKQILSLSTSFKSLDYGDGGTSTWAPDVVFLRSGDVAFEMSSVVEPFDYVLVVYADLLQPDLRKQIDASYPVYADDEIVLLKTTSSASWRNKSLHAPSSQNPDGLDGHETGPETIATKSYRRLSHLTRRSG
ncbi:MAG: hypothetical protein HC869_04560, partial [Rhodospirillales bacterium]|nr:hypothetical protein [Rhodospirillales bacterium]